MVDQEAFGRFLRQRRERLAPQDVGLSVGARRRTPGLRRQEVAQLAGISVEYYVKLEQGRGSIPSAQVLSALSRALVLSRDERAYLFRLAGDVAPAGTGPSSEVSPAVRFLIGNMPEVPAYVVDAAWNVLAWNELAGYFIGELLHMPEGHRNLARWMFLAPDTDPHWSSPSSLAFAQIVVSDLRSSFLRYPHYPEIEALTSELADASTRFEELWNERRDQPQAVQKALTIPECGEFLFDCQMLQIGSTGQQLVTYCAEADSPVREALRQVAAGSLAVLPEAVRYGG